MGCLFNDAVSSSDYKASKRMIINNGFQRGLMREITAYCCTGIILERPRITTKVISQYGRYSDRDANLGPPTQNRHRLSQHARFASYCGCQCVAQSLHQLYSDVLTRVSFRVAGSRLDGGAARPSSAIITLPWSYTIPADRSTSPPQLLRAA
jgi:hypothetical protein